MPPRKKQRQENVLSQGRNAKRKRTRNGCLTCRDRHLKCDEKFPICNNCIKSKRECFRGIRLKFLNTSIHKLAPNPFNVASGNEKVFMDQSIITASHYQDGEESYSKYKGLHSLDELRKAELDFDQHTSLALKDSSLKRPKIKRTQDLRTNSANFRNLLEGFLKIETVDTDADLLQTQDLILTKFNYFEPPVGLQNYLKDVKVHKSKLKKHDSIERANEENSADYYIFDSDEEQDHLADAFTCKDEALLKPISDPTETLLLLNYLTKCRWFLNGITDNTADDYWLNCVLSEKLKRDRPRFWFLLKSSGSLMNGYMGEKPNSEISDNEQQLTKMIESVVNDTLEDLLKENSFERDVRLLTLVITGYFQKICHERTTSDALFQYINLFNDVYIKKALNKSSTMTVDDPMNTCIVIVFIIDSLTSIIFNRDPVISSFGLEKVMLNKVTDYSYKEVHNFVQHKIESAYEYTDSEDSEYDDSDDDDAMEESEQVPHSMVDDQLKLKNKDNFQFTDSSYLITLLNIMGRLNQLVRTRDTRSPSVNLTNWKTLLNETLEFEQNIPFAFSPILLGPLKTQAPQGLATMGLTTDISVTDFAAEPPFPYIRFANEMGLLIHIIHHSIYLLSEKYHSKGLDSFLKMTKDYLKFRSIIWYNDTIPQDSHGYAHEKLHMARRVISYFLSCRKLQKHDTDNIWFFYGWCFELAKEFLPADDLKALDKRL